MKPIRVAGVVALCFAGATARGLTLGTANNGDWSDTNTWTTATVPTASDVVRVNNNRTVTLSTGTHTVIDLWVAHQLTAPGTFHMTGGSLTVTREFSTVAMSGGAGTTTMSGGTLTAANTHIGVPAGRSGSGAGVFTISGGTLGWGSLLSVGVISSGTLRVDGTSAVLSGSAITLSTNSTLRFNLGASSVSPLAASGALTIDSAAQLIIDGSDFTGENGTVIDLITFGSRAGIFSTENIIFQNFSGGLGGEIGYGADSMYLTVVTPAITAMEVSAAGGSNLVRVSFEPSFSALWFTPGLTEPAWTNVASGSSPLSHTNTLSSGFYKVLAVNPLQEQIDKIRNLSALVQPPALYPAEGLELDGTPGQTFVGDPDAYNIRPLFYEGLPYKGAPTRVFAWYGVPKNATVKVPAVVLVHGGGGTAFSEWVRQWNDRGFAAIAIAHEGQLEIREDPKRRVWKKHDWPGPARSGIYADHAEPIEDQYMYHAVADTILANSLLRSMPEIDAGKVGIMGISWGGVITTTAIGIDHRFAFAIPTYGCGHLHDTENQWGRALGNNDLYIGAWDPFLRMGEVTIPVCWYSWPEDNHFDLAAQAKTYRAMPGPKMVILRPQMKHGGVWAWGPPDSYAFAKSILETGRPWAWQVAVEKENPAQVIFHCTRPVDRAELIYTLDTGFTGDRTWLSVEAPFVTEQDQVVVSPAVPPGTTGWIVNLRCGELLVSSEYIDSVFEDI